MANGDLDVLLTGATGFLGHYVLADLLARPNVRCRVLLRPPLAEGQARLAEL
ncbi:MAG: SDR family oxidoreductase, partial [Phycisphaerae bacterium]